MKRELSQTDRVASLKAEAPWTGVRGASPKLPSQMFFLTIRLQGFNLRVLTRNTLFFYSGPYLEGENDVGFQLNIWQGMVMFLTGLVINTRRTSCISKPVKKV